MLGTKGSKAAAAGALAALALALAACSSSSSSSSAASGSSSSTAAASAVSTAGSGTLHSELPASLQGESSINVAAVSDYPPLSYAAAGSTTIEGFDIDLLNAAASVLGTKFNFVNTSYDSLIPALQANRFVIAEGGAADTAVNEKVTTMIDYLESTVQLLVQPGNPDGLTTLSAACGHTIATLAGSPDYVSELQSASNACTAAGKAKITIDTFQTEDESVLALTAGRVQATFDSNFSNAYRVKAGQKVQILTTDYLKTPIGFQVLPAQKQLATALTNAVNKLIANGTYKQLLAKWSLTSSVSEAAINESSSSAS